MTPLWKYLTTLPDVTSGDVLPCLLLPLKEGLSPASRMLSEAFFRLRVSNWNIVLTIRVNIRIKPAIWCKMELPPALQSADVVMLLSHRSQLEPSYQKQLCQQCVVERTDDHTTDDGRAACRNHAKANCPPSYGRGSQGIEDSQRRCLSGTVNKKRGIPRFCFLHSGFQSAAIGWLSRSLRTNGERSHLISYLADGKKTCSPLTRYSPIFFWPSGDVIQSTSCMAPL